MSVTYIFGGVMFEGQAIGSMQLSREAGNRIARHQVLDGGIAMERVGTGEEPFAITGVLAPFAGFSALDLMGQLRAIQASPQLLMRGDGRLLGWYLLENLSEKHQYISGGGTGRKVEFTAKFTRMGGAGGGVSGLPVLGSLPQIAQMPGVGALTTLSGLPGTAAIPGLSKISQILGGARQVANQVAQVQKFVTKLFS
ncbi:phage tail protein [Polycladidibacter hongkongensis]|uniref:phage tail protein n=1 Tax=Polycladidibacter hongkongensis TaxID=1647556 RepID=UPI000829C05D|nr:phage tail protein [Pseudovibrio hongkongensis]